METNLPEGKIKRLVKPRKKGITRIIFSRFFLIVLLIFLQAYLVLQLVDAFPHIIPHYTFFQTLFTIGMVVYLFNSSMDSSAKLTWLVIIAVAPVPGALFLAFTQLEIGHRALKRRLSDIIRESRGQPGQDEAVLKELAGDGSGTDDLWRYINRTGDFPVSVAENLTYYDDVAEAFPLLLERIENAKKFIYLEFFIVDEGYMWGRVLDVLERKVKEGVDVRLLYDGMCDLQNLPIDYPKRVQALGIKCKKFSPVRPFISTYYNYRDHRKNLVIDGEYAYTGGFNFADEYINHIRRFGHWKDNVLAIQGEAVRTFTMIFLQMWSVDEPVLDFSPCHVPVRPAGIPAPETGAENGYILPFADSPLDGEKVGENVYMDILNRATEYVYIMTPYLILDDEMKNALCFAAKRGVDVSIILPGIPDKKVAYSLAKSHYRYLLEQGVKIYEYTPGFVHAKVFVCDDEKAVVGTINLDYRSLYHHFECACYLYKVPAIVSILGDFIETQKKCREVTFETIKHEKLYYKVMGHIMKFFAPLM